MGRLTSEWKLVHEGSMDEWTGDEQPINEQWVKEIVSAYK